MDFRGRYFVSTLAIRWNPWRGINEAHHNLSTYDCFHSEDEARGRAVAWMEKQWPKNDGWEHNIRILAHDAPNPALASAPSPADPPGEPGETTTR